MHGIELILGLLVVVTLTVTLSRRVGLPYPILLVLGGLLLAQIPGLPRDAFHLEPELVFLFFLPPLLFSAGFFTSIRDFRANARPIALLAVGLVLATTLIVGTVVNALVPGLGLPIALAFGAIVSPPDAIAATAIAKRLGLPRRIVTILEGESLVNDATALVLYRLALVTAATGTFSLSDAALQLILVAAGGVAIGLVVGWLVTWLMGRLDDPPVEIAISMLAPYVAYLPAEQLHVSGVLSAVTAGLWVGYRSPRVMSSDSRLLGTGAWQMLLFLLNGLAFILIGLQLPTIVPDRPAGELLGLAGAVVLTVILVRIAWVFPATYLPRILSARLRARDPSPPPQAVLVVSWAGMRGVVSLAAALALPLQIAGRPFPERDLLIFLTFSVILATLVGQGLTLPLLARWLGVSDDGSEEHEERHAREAAVQAALERIERLAGEWPGHRELVDNLRATFEHRVAHLTTRDEPGDEAEQELLEHRLIRRAVLDAEREVIIAMRDRGEINDEVLRRVQRDLDLEELRMEA